MKPSLETVFESLMEFGHRCIEDARKTQYLCEIAMDEAQLECLLDAIGPFRHRFVEPGAGKLRMALAVAAVNFAYFQEKDEAFREPFLRRLKIPFDPKNIERLFEPLVGGPVEQAIEEWSKRQNPNVGKPFRYVGLIREQAGLPKHRLPQFAAWLCELRKTVGWDAIPYLSLQRLENLIRNGFANSFYAREFLSSEPGREFVRSVCADLVRFFDEGRLTPAELDTLPSYRRGFMTELVAELQRGESFVPRPPKKYVPKFQDPVLVLDPMEGRLYLRFEYEEVLRNQITCDQCQGHPLDAKLEIGQTIPLRPSYSGRRTVMTNEQVEWRTDGWDPIEDLAVIFEASGPLVWRPSDSRALAPGEYLLVTSAKFTGHVPEQVVIAELTPLFLADPAPTDYRVRRIHIQAGDRIDDLGLYTAALSQPPSMEACGMQPWSGFSTMDVVWPPNAARLHLRNWTEQNAARFHVCLRIGDEVQRLTAISPIGPDTASIDLTHLPVGTLGTVFLEAIGRRARTAETNPRFTFAIWPKCNFEFPQQLHDEESIATILLHLASDVIFEPNMIQALRSKQFTGNGAFATDSNVLVQRGVLRYGGAIIGVSIPIRRAKFWAIDDPRTPFILDPHALNAMHRSSLAGLPCWLRLRARPLCEIQLLLAPLAGDASPVVIMTRLMPESGECNVQVNEILDSLRSTEMSIGQFEIFDGQTHARTSAIYVDTALLCRTTPIPNAKLVFPDCVGTALSIIRQIKEGPTLPEFDVSLIRPSELRERIASLCVASLIFDNVLGSGERERGYLCFTTSQVKRRLWRIRCILGRAEHPSIGDASAHAKKLLLLWDAINPGRHLQNMELSLPRWIRRLESIREELQRLSLVDQRVKGLLTALKTGEAIVPDAPRGLYMALRHYVRAEGLAPTPARERLIEAVQHLTAQRGKGVPPWSEMTHILWLLGLLRACRIHEFLRAIPNIPMPRYTCRARMQLELVASNLRSQICSSNLPSDTLGLAEVSPRQDDGLLAAAIETNGREGWRVWQHASKTCWLAAYLGWRYAILTQADRDIRERLRESFRVNLEFVPDHLDRDVIMNELHTDKVEAWA